MMYPAIRKTIAVAACFCLLFTNNLLKAQASDTLTASEISDKKPPKPFRILTEGKRITIQSKQDINRIMVWSASGNRFVEETNVNASNYNFNVPSGEKYVFIMLQ